MKAGVAAAAAVGAAAGAGTLLYLLLRQYKQDSSYQTVWEQSQSGQKSSEKETVTQGKTVNLEQSEVKTVSEKTNDKTFRLEQSEAKRSKLKEIELIEDTAVNLSQSHSPQTVTLEQSGQIILESTVAQQLQSDNQSSLLSESPVNIQLSPKLDETVNRHSEPSQTVIEQLQYSSDDLPVNTEQSDKEIEELTVNSEQLEKLTGKLYRSEGEEKQSGAKTVTEKDETVKLKQSQKGETVILIQSQGVLLNSEQSQSSSDDLPVSIEQSGEKFIMSVDNQSSQNSNSPKTPEYILDISKNFDSEFYEPKINIENRPASENLENINELQEGEIISQKWEQENEGIKEGKEGREENEGIDREAEIVRQKEEIITEIQDKKEIISQKDSKQNIIEEETGQKLERKRERQRTRGDSASADLEYEPPEQEVEQQEISEGGISYDAASQKSMDSGQGSSEIEPETLFQLSSYPPPSNEQYIFYDFEIKQSLVGRLIGRRGAFVNRIKATTQATVVVHQHPNRQYKMCTVEGTRTQVESALEMIRQMFPLNRYPDVTLEQVITANSAPPTGLPINIDTNSMKMELAAGVMVEVRVSSVVSGGEIYVHQPLHPNFSALHRLHNCLKLNYGDGTNTPPIPSPIQEGTVCVGNVEGEWVRCQVLSEHQGEAVCLLLDTGSTVYINSSALRQIRYDYMALPFQATQCFLYGIQPKEGDMWSEEASNTLNELVGDDILFCCVECYTQDYVPIVSLYKTQQHNEHIHLNQRLVELGHADWIPQPG